jgi:hypothetical protein
MADYNKQTVAQLRQLLKDRGIPSTGLTRKAQIVEKLVDADQSNEATPVTDADANAPDATENATASEAAPAASIDDALPDSVEQVDEEAEKDTAVEKPEVPGPALADAGGKFTDIANFAHQSDPPPELAAQPSDTPEIVTPPVFTATIDANRQTVSHIDSYVPAPDPIKVMEITAEETTMEDEPGTIEPATVFNGAPADVEDFVGPKITEPADEEAQADTKDEVTPDELPDAPRPAAEALKFAPQMQEDAAELSDAEMEIEEPASASNEQSSVEKSELLAIPEGSTAETSRLNTEELEADSRKRKRRSQSPSVPYQDIKAKKPRPSEDPVPEVYLKEDDDAVMDQVRPQDNSEPATQGENANGTQTPPTEGTETTLHAPEPDVRREKKEKTDRYSSLVKPSRNVPQDALQDDRPMVPALHPATPALYIRNFMRPLRPDPLRAHLVSLASPPSSSPDASIVKALFVDAMKTHALVLFTNMTAASRARASLHGTIWPPEANRKELWVDFVPEEKVEDWIATSEAAMTAEKEGRLAGRPIPAKRFEVVYPENSDGLVTAVFQEIGSSAPFNAPRGPRGTVENRRPSQQVPLPTAPTQDTRQDIEQSFKTLDQLFSSTTAKPNLYYLTVSDAISESRLKELDVETSRDWAPGETRKGRGIKTEMKYKYSFDNEDRLVEVGEDRGPWAEDYRARGGFRGRGRGAFRGRGDGWRG